MSELTLAVIKIGFLAVLWLFVITALSIMRSDIFAGTPVTRRGGRTVAPKMPRQPRPQRPGKPRRGVPGKLVVTQGALAGTTVSLSSAPVLIGRAPDSTLVLTDDYASTRHARVFPQEGDWYVEDLGSTNGTYLDRSKVTGPTQVPLGVPIRIGKTVLELRK
jgi:FHA domain